MQISTAMLQDRAELMRALEANGIVYSVTSENYQDSGEISWPKCYAAAQNATTDGDLYFGAHLPCTIGDKEISILTVEDQCWIEDMFEMTTAQVVSRMAEFIAGAYWADVALGA